MRFLTYIIAICVCFMGCRSDTTDTQHKVTKKPNNVRNYSQVTASLNQYGALRIVGDTTGNIIEVIETSSEIIVGGQRFPKNKVLKVRIICNGGQDMVYWGVEGAEFYVKEDWGYIDPGSRSWTEIKVEDDDGKLVFEVGLRVNGATKATNPFITVVQDSRSVQPTTLLFEAGNKNIVIPD